MPRDENGVYTPLRDWEADAANGTPFSPDRWNAQDADFAEALNDLPLKTVVPTVVPAGTLPTEVNPGSIMYEDGVVYIRIGQPVWVDVSSVGLTDADTIVEDVVEAVMDEGSALFHDTVLTGVPTAPTATTGTDTTQVATTEFVVAEIAAEIADLQPTSAKGLANGYAGLDSSGKVPVSQLPDAVLNVRERLTANRTYYVRSDGSDANNGLSDASDGAFATIQKALDVAVGLDLSIYTVTIQVGAGTYTAGAVLKSVLGTINIIGDTTTPSNVVIQPASGACFTAVSVQGRYFIAGFKTITTGGAIQYSVQGSFIELGHNEYGNAAGSGIHIYCGSGGRVITGNGNYTISAEEFGYHLFVDNNSVVYGGSRTVTLTGNPTFATFAHVTGGGNLRYPLTASGSVTAGKKYNVALNGTIESSGSTYPGPTAGTTASGGQFT